MSSCLVKELSRQTTLQNYWVARSVFRDASDICTYRFARNFHWRFMLQILWIEYVSTLCSCMGAECRQHNDGTDATNPLPHNALSHMVRGLCLSLVILLLGLVLYFTWLHFAVRESVDYLYSRSTEKVGYLWCVPYLHEFSIESANCSARNLIIVDADVGMRCSYQWVTVRFMSYTVPLAAKMQFFPQVSLIHF